MDHERAVGQQRIMRDRRRSTNTTEEEGKYIIAAAVKDPVFRDGTHALMDGRWSAEGRVWTSSRGSTRHPKLRMEDEQA